jgi:hypothetical protein
MSLQMNSFDLGKISQWIKHYSISENKFYVLLIICKTHVGEKYCDLAKAFYWENQ